MFGVNWEYYFKIKTGNMYFMRKSHLLLIDESRMTCYSCDVYGTVWERVHLFLSSHGHRSPEVATFLTENGTHSLYNDRTGTQLGSHLQVNYFLSFLSLSDRVVTSLLVLRMRATSVFSQHDVKSHGKVHLILVCCYPARYLPREWV